MSGTVTPVYDSFSCFAADIHAPREPVQLVHHLLTGLQSFIPADYNSWKEITYQKGSRVTAVFHPHNPTAATLLPMFQRHVALHPICRYWRQSGQHTGAISWSDVAKRAEFERSELYEEFYRPLGIQHQLLVALNVGPSTITYLALNRSRSAFTAQERTLLATIQPHASQALHHSGELRRLRAMLGSFETFVDRLSQGIVCLSPTNRINWASKRARDLLRTYCGCSLQSVQLPDAVVQWLLTQEQPCGPQLTTLRPLAIQHQAGRLMIRLLKEKTERYLFLEAPPDQPTFSELTSLGLTDREAEVLGWIAQGKSNDDTAVLLGTCVQTVKKHLERIYDTLGVANRTEAAVKAQAVLKHSS